MIFHFRAPKACGETKKPKGPIRLEKFCILLHHEVPTCSRPSKTPNTAKVFRIPLFSLLV